MLVPAFLRLIGQSTEMSGAPAFLRLLSKQIDSLEPRQIAIAIICIISIKSVATFAATSLSSVLARRIVAGLREKAITIVTSANMEYFSSLPSGQLLGLISGVSQVGKFYQLALALVVLLLSMFAFIVVLISLSWKLTFLSSLMLVVLIAVNQQIVQRVKTAGKDTIVYFTKLNTYIVEIISGIKLVKLFAAEKRAEQEFLQRSNDFDKAELTAQLFVNSVHPLNEALGIVALLSVVALSSIASLDDSQALLITFLVVVFRLLPLIASLNHTRTELARLHHTAESTMEFLATTPAEGMPNGTRVFTKLEDALCFRQVSFAYKNKQQLVLDNVDLYLRKGKSIGLVGSSGAGKSTIADLICRFYDPTAGVVTVDGVDLREFDIGTLRRKIGVVSQETFLFHDSIRANILYGKPEASESEMVDAARRAKALDFIQKLPEGFDTVVGNRGALLSGGERQRLAIARAILVDPDILILDEATSSLDSISERAVQAAIEELLPGRTSLIIAHRLSTLQRCDQIAVLEDGKIVELDNHGALIKQAGHYARFYNAQLNHAD